MEGLERRNYTITVQGLLDGRWSDHLGGLSFSYEADTTVLSGPIEDQAALRGLLNRIFDLNLTIISVQSSWPADASGLESSPTQGGNSHEPDA